MKLLPGLGPYEGQRLEPVALDIPVVLGGETVIDLQQDHVYKELIYIYDWVITPTYASGTPKLHHRGVTHALINKLEVGRAAGDVLKVFRGIAQLQDQLEWGFGQPCPTLSCVNSTTLGAATISNVGAPALPPTTQAMAVREAFAMPFENKLSSQWYETCMNLAGINTAKIRISHGTAAQAQDPADSTTVTFVITGKLSVYAVYADHMIDKVDFDDWEQSYDDVNMGTIALNNTTFELKPQGLLQGLHLSAFKGVKSENLTHEELSKFNVKIEYNGNFVYNGSMAAFMMTNGCKSAMSRLLPSSAYLNLLNNSTYGTGLQTVQDGAFRPLRVTVTTPASLNGTAIRMEAKYDIIKVR